MMVGCVVRASLWRQPALVVALPFGHSVGFRWIPGVLLSCVSGSRAGEEGRRCWEHKCNIFPALSKIRQPGESLRSCISVAKSSGRKEGKQEMASQAGSDPPAPGPAPPPPSTFVPGNQMRFLAPKLSFCSECGGAIEQQIPQGEHELRAVCTVCGRIHYQNPKMVVGCLVEHEGKVLLCRRSIQPSYGLWTLPAGFMELGESAAEGAARETWEEANAQVEVLSLFAHLDIPFIGQSYIIFRAKLRQPTFSPGPESLECALFQLEDIPYDMLAFSSIQVALKLYVEDAAAGCFRVHHGVIDKRPGARPSDPVVVRDHLAM